MQVTPTMRCVRGSVPFWAVLRRKKVDTPATIAITHCHDTPIRLPSTDPLSVAEREGARSLAVFSRDCCSQVQLSLDRSC